ncbi:MAG: S-methyl-5-thioribose-1-phosphate isomerase [Oligosphaeraceae bacterium]|nr:S-methyl-5-thioribose-1-phosphate isomerase [Oligosphaeraceae bacterium]
MNLPPPTVQWLDDSGTAFRAPGADAARPGMLDIIDQTRLPQCLHRLQLCEQQEIHAAITRLCVRGAPAIGCAAALGLAACAQRFTTTDPADFRRQLEHTAAFLNSSRPTAVNLSWALQRCLNCLTAESMPVPALQQQLLDEALAILAEDIGLCEAIGRHGLQLLQPGQGVLTHCNAGALATGGCGTALAPLYAAHQAGYNLKVFSDETRPLLQGSRLTAWELSCAGLDVTTICDSMAAQVMREGLVSLVLVGADRVAANGDTANKIGTYQLAITASYHRIPFYVAMPYSTIDRSLPSGREIPIEQRSPEEIFHCQGAKVYNPAFDVTPHELISGYITERGICRKP